MVSMRAALTTFLAFSLLGFTLHARTAEPLTLIDTMIEAYGGEKNLARMDHYTQVWQIETKTSDTNGTDRREVHLPGYLKTELVYPHKTEIRTLENGIGTKQFGTQTIPAQGPMLDAMKAQLLRLYHPGILKEKASGITVSETPEHYVLSLRADTLTSEYFVSRKSRLIDKVVGRLQMGAQTMEFLTLYEEYRSRSGVMVPHREVKYAGSVNTAVMRLGEMDFIPSSR